MSKLCHIRDVPGNTMTGAPLTDDELAEMHKALGHPARMIIIRHLERMDQCICGELVDILPLAQSTVSRHIKVLKDAGFIRGTISGPRTCYCLDRDMLNRFKAAVADM